MILLIIAIILIAATIYFWDDFPKWIANAKKLWNEIPVLYDRNIKTRPKPNVTKEDIFKIQQQQMKEAKVGFQQILESRKPEGYGQDLKERLTRFQQQIDNRKASKSKSTKGQRMTDWERKYLWDGISKRKRVPCIHCEIEDMYKGPNDGPSQIWRCPNCGQGIKLSFYANTLSGFQGENLGINQNWIK
jgi:hypothetical protein